MSLQLRELAQLFNSMDPSPFHDRDLDADAEEFIVSWARETPHNAPLELTINLASGPTAHGAAGVGEAVRHYFTHRAEMKQRELNLLMRRGRTSLVVGLVFLAACLGLSKLASTLSRGTVASLLDTSLTIIGWVAMWRPLEIYLYDWWPIRDERRVLERLARMRVALSHPPTPASEPPRTSLMPPPVEQRDPSHC